MESYKNYSMDRADLMLHPIIGGELILLNYVGFAQETFHYGSFLCYWKR
ncbi:hypothetical protein Xish_02903 [Xenorhabdus ishibashii]|uniref:Uncharacterized protein n=1 Tax=Xenorhabdus ishibashii TaxID=1034471 RepID=A0A2D0KK89_9GAMM|nr:hypothetical protein Xish_02903 [Xenorhabdus ishibashii]